MGMKFQSNEFWSLLVCQLYKPKGRCLVFCIIFVGANALRVPLICEEMHFKLIGRKNFLTAGRVGPSTPQASKQRTQEVHSKNEIHRIVLKRERDNLDSRSAT